MDLSKKKPRAPTDGPQVTTEPVAGAAADPMTGKKWKSNRYVRDEKEE